MNETRISQALTLLGNDDEIRQSPFLLLSKLETLLFFHRATQLPPSVQTSVISEVESTIQLLDKMRARDRHGDNPKWRTTFCAYSLQIDRDIQSADHLVSADLSTLSDSFDGSGHMLVSESMDSSFHDSCCSYFILQSIISILKSNEDQSLIEVGRVQQYRELDLQLRLDLFKILSFYDTVPSDKWFKQFAEIAIQFPGITKELCSFAVGRG